MEMFIIIFVGLLSASAISLSVIVLNKYSSFVSLTNINNNYNKIVIELEDARKAVQILTDNDNQHTEQILGLTNQVTPLMAAKMIPQANRSYVPSRNAG